MFRVIPVIDLMHGRAVAARGGKRDSYQPLESCISESPDPKKLIEGLLKLHDFRTLYVADLDAMLGKKSQLEIILALQEHFPQITFWIDGGIRSFTDYTNWKTGAFGCQAIIGSETYSDEEQRRLPADSILSLDFIDAQPYGNGQLCAKPELWPARLIVLSLGKVGSLAGPDLERMEQIRTLSPDAEVYAGGGIRHHADLESLRSMRFSGALVGTALYQGRIRSPDLDTLYSK